MSLWKDLAGWFRTLFPSRAERKRRRARRSLARLVADTENNVSVHPDDFDRVKISMAGKGNTIRIGKLREGQGIVNLRIFGSGCRIDIAEDVLVCRDLTVVLGMDHPHHGAIEDAAFTLGAGVRVEDCKACVLTSHGRIEVGAGGQISVGVTLYNTDAHPVYRLGSDKPVNRARTLHVGDHVWIGAHVTVLKNAHIPDDCIVGWGSVVTGRFEHPHCALGGNPAKVIAEGITWGVNDPRYLAGE